MPRVCASCPDGAALMSIRWGRGHPGVLRRVAPVVVSGCAPAYQDDAKATIGQVTMKPLDANVVPCAVPLKPTTVP